MLSNNGDGIVVLKTIVGIMIDVLSHEPHASFAFIGMPLVNETIDTTKRYIVYEKFCKRYFRNENFEHAYDVEKSFYMLLNRKVNIEEIYSKISDIAEMELTEVSESLDLNYSRSTS